MPRKKTEEKAQQARIDKKLYRSEKDKIIAGVAGGLGEYFNVDSTIIRIIFVLLTLFGGSGILIYLILWILIPSSSSIDHLSDQTIKQNVEEIKGKVKEYASNVKNNYQSKKTGSRYWTGILIIIVGVLFLLNNMGVLEILNIERFWPLVLIVIGLAIILK